MTKNKKFFINKFFPVIKLFYTKNFTKLVVVVVFVYICEVLNYKYVYKQY